MPAAIQSTLNQVTQIAPEPTPGAVTAATHRFASMGIPMNPARNIQEFRPRGYKFSTAHAQTREWSEGSIGDGSGLAYNEVQYILASMVSKGTTTQRTETDGTGATVAVPGVFDWEHDISTFSKDDVQTYTIETGDIETGRFYQVPYSYFTGMTIESSRGGEVSLSGDLVGNARQDAAPTVGTAEVELIPVTPDQLNVYMDVDATSIGTTQLDGNFSVSAGLTDRAAQVWFHGRQYAGPAGRVETPPSASLELVQADGSEVDEMLTSLANGARRFFRLEWVGPQIGTSGVNYSLKWDIAAKIGDAESYDDEEGVYAATVPFVAEHDGDWGRAMTFAVTNDRETL